MEDAKNSIKDLVERFHRNIDVYKNGKYNETQVRREFIDPFFEAKKPSVNIKTDISPAFQLRRYAWSAKLPLSIVTDLEELAIYDCRRKTQVSHPLKIVALRAGKPEV